MAEQSWWEQVLNRMFAIGASGMLANRDVLGMDPGPSPPPAATRPTPAPAAQPAPVPGQTEAEQIKAGIGQSVSAAAPPNPLYGSIPDGKVYLGQNSTAYDERARPGVWRPNDKTASIQDVIGDLNGWSEKKRKKFSDLAVDAGLMSKPSILHDDLERVLGALAIRSAKLYERGIKATPWSLLEKYAAGSMAAAKKAPLGPITTTSTSTSTNLSSAREANSLVDAALAQRLGRSATEKEKKEFLAALNAAEKKEPTTTKTTTTTTGSGTAAVRSDSSTQTSGGVNASSFAEEWGFGHNKDEAGSYQALATYMPAFFGALGAPV